VEAARLGSDLARRDRERRRLAGAVGAKQREHLTGCEREVDAVQDVDAAVPGAHLRELHHRLDRDVPNLDDRVAGGHVAGGHVAALAVPRYARWTAGSD